MKAFTPGPLSPLRKAILEVVAEGPLPAREIGRLLNEEYIRIGSEIHSMVSIKQLKICGTAHEAGYVDGYKSTTRAFGLPDAPMLPSVLSPVRSRPRNAGGSGIIAPSPYRTGYRWGLL